MLGLRTRGAQPVRVSSAPYRDPADGDPALLDPATLADPTGQSLVLLLSDGAGAAWRDGRIRSVLDRWARCGPTAVVHTLPRRMWPGSGLPAEFWTVSTPRPGAANADWRVHDPLLPYGAPEREDVPVPVLELTPAALADWSRLVASSGGQAQLALWEPRPQLPRQTRPRPPAAVDPDRAALARLDRFQAAASPEAYRLAAHLAAVAPVTVPVMRLVQAATPDGGDPVPLAEVFLGGLVRPAPPSAARPAHAAHHRLFDFPDVVKDRLLDDLPTAELVEVGHRVSRQLDSLAGRSPDFPAWLLGATGGPGPGPGLRADGAPFAWAGGTLLRRLGIGPGEGPGEGSGGGEGKPWWRARARAESWSLAAVGLAERGRLQPLGLEDQSKVGPYSVLGKLSPGTERWLFAARKDDGELVMLRTGGPRPRSQRTWGFLADEVKNLQGLGPRYNTPLITWDTTDHEGWLATVLPVTSGGVPAPTLREFIEACGPVGPTPFLHHLGLHLARALRGAASANLLHGRLSPDRILITEHAPVITSWQHRPGSWGELPAADWRSAAYRAPGPGRLALEAEVFALAAVLCYAWTGRDPHPASRPPDLSVPAGGHSWRTVLANCLGEDPVHRPRLDSLIGEFGYLLGTGAEDTPLTAWMPQRGLDLLRVDAPQRLGNSVGLHPTAEPARSGGAPRLRHRSLRTGAPPRPKRLRRVAVLCPTVGVGLATTAAMLGAALVERNGAADEEVVVLDSGRGADALAAWGDHKVPGGLWGLVDSVTHNHMPNWHGQRDYLAAGPGGVHLLAGERGQLRPWGLTGSEYKALTDHLGRTFRTMVTSVRAPTFDGHVRDVLYRTDQLVIVTGPQPRFLREAAGLLGQIQENQYLRDLARSSVVAVSYTRPRARGLSMLERLCREVVTIPYDDGLNWGDLEGLEELGAETWQTFRHLADLVSED